MTRTLGFVLIGLSLLLYGSLLLVPFTPLPIESKAAASAALVIAGEVAFWVGGLLLGKELVSKYRQRLNPARWLQHRSKRSPDEPGH